jgi:D-glycero-D-manno-heptose 1,7-bisphosphate phosphatase
MSPVPRDRGWCDRFFLRATGSAGLETVSASACHSFPPEKFHAVFLDRDGTLNVSAPQGSYITSPAELRLLAGAARAVRALNEAGLLVLVVTNQRGIALGTMTLVEVQVVNQALQRRLGRSRAWVDSFYVSPQDLRSCNCRKPAPELLQWADDNYPHQSPNRRVVIGDAGSEVQAGLSAGASPIRRGPPCMCPSADAPSPDLSRAVDTIVGSPTMPRRP